MHKMGLKKLKVCTFCSLSIWVFVLLSFLLNTAQCQDVNDYDQVENPDVLPIVISIVNNRLSPLTNLLSKDISERAGFCIKDQKTEWNKAFNFESNLDFLASCILQTRGSIMRRVCTAAEAKFYIDMFFRNASSLRPNRNCNLTSWVAGCEPGWACSVGQNETVDIENSKVIPSRTTDCQPCCAGFFCPRSLTCMIPCPLGSHCPQATLNTNTSLCEPYNYQLPPGKPNHTCGGANIWADIGTSREVFCSAGSYCPSTVQEKPCSSGHYCRTGSTSEKRCFKLTSCDSHTSIQDLHAYGVMLIAAIFTLLLTIYNCSDQVLNTRERRLAKTREAAARSARETAKAPERWKADKNAATKRTSGLQTRTSQRISFKKATKEPDEELKIFDQTFETDEHLYTPVYMSTSSESLSSSAPSKVQPIEPNNPIQVMLEIEDTPENYVEFEVSSHDRKSKGQTTKGKRPRTHSQIFKYAYAQIEKEKAQQQDDENLTFSGVVSVAYDPEMRKRPLIEVSFKDLTLTLKGKDKHLLRYVTGKIRPGRITAVMGPSGAGKTTFISALAGKAMGCKVTGLVLINGKNESIRSYRKIIGYVPQDDIVHGNLTVEENLWFNAKCRLPACLTKPDKVLVVERVIESLGLQSVRDSLVGTVEKRGISGGQRKRVNVGLEMVMEPSLLILDEPTSGLDSASSLQLLRALRHEALEGVNICMVLHQPSYSLFQMFDDLVLLAKGGFTVYHGSAEKAEQYFADLGIHVPDRVNPPDHFIDILEGIVTPSRSSGVNYKELPVRWMLHNGYPVPPELQQTAARIATPSVSPAPANGTSPPHAGIDERSFAGDLWQDVSCNVTIHRDSIRHNLLKFKDLSRRRTPSVLWQYRYFLGRVAKQRMREAKVQATDYLILLLAGACLGTIAKSGEENFGAIGYTYTIIAVSLLCKIAALRSFSVDKLQYWRESASGMSSLAYFLAKDTVDHFNTVIKPAVYLSMFFFFTNPRSSFSENYTVLLCLVYCVTGIGYAFAIFFQPGPAQLWSVLVPVVSTLVAIRTQDNEVLKKMSIFCYPKWALEAFVISNAERYYGVWLITRCGALLKSGYSLHDWTLCIAILVLTGVISRAIAYLGMITFQK
ncbi:ABC transporter G family member 24-like [Hibiscus syriacus]|uniref:ABC transporter G family member 24-like n=1 Tax=Hibiscus syriacus TaxID=106335 RepID=UPI001923E277|nr:ABC transporter G family member 24-like [Hibiscus syriacus]